MSQIPKIAHKSFIFSMLLVCIALLAACQQSAVLSGKAYWKPEPGDLLQIQYTGEPLDLSVEAYVYSIDLFETSRKTIDKLHKQGKKVICYINSGAWEEYRPDADEFPEKAIGKDYEGWPGEKWLDISQYTLFQDIILARFDLAVEKGCDGINADNMQNYEEETGFAISAEDQLAYNHWLSEQAHQRGLSIGLKNDPQQADELAAYFDWSLIEDCHFYDWCELLLPFVSANKAIFQIEYTDHYASIDGFCSQSYQPGFSSFLKNRELDAWVEYCP